MNSVNMHLALTHVPVMLSIFGLIMLIVAIILKNKSLTKTSYVMLIVAGIAAIPVYISGEGSEESVENLAGISEAVIEEHEDVAFLGMISISATGLLAVIAMLSFQWLRVSFVLKRGVLMFAIVSGGLMAQTAHLGGQIRHSEIRSDVAMQNGNNSDVVNENNNRHNEADDD